MTETNETGSVGKHWIHHKFVENLMAASKSKDDLSKAAKEWAFEKMYVSRGEEKCQLCNTSIKTCVVLANNENDVYLIIGEDCYDKLYHFLKTGKVESALPLRTERTKALRSEWKKRFKEFRDRTVMGWFKERLETGKVPSEIEDIIYTIVRLRFAPTKADADAAIKYYKANRKFRLEAFLDVGDYDNIRHKSMLPAEITIDCVGRFRHAADHGRAVNLALSRVAMERRRIEYAREKYDQVLHSLGWLRADLEAAVKKEVKGAEEGLALIDECKKEIEAMVAGFSGTSKEMNEIATRAKELWEKCEYVTKWQVSDSERVLFVERSGAKSYVLVKKSGRWQPIWEVKFELAEGVSCETGVYEARLSSKGVNTLVMLERKIKDANDLVMLDFKEKSRSGPGYVAFYQGKAVLPSRTVRFPGEALAFLTNEEGRYYRAWVIEDE